VEFVQRKAKCYVCHQGKKKPNCNPYGRQFTKLLDIRRDKEDEPKIVAALIAVGKLPSAADDPASPTYDAWIARSELPGGKLEDVRREPPARPNDGTQDDGTQNDGTQDDGTQDDGTQENEAPMDDGAVHEPVRRSSRRKNDERRIMSLAVVNQGDERERKDDDPRDRQPEDEDAAGNPRDSRRRAVRTPSP